MKALLHGWNLRERERAEYTKGGADVGYKYMQCNNGTLQVTWKVFFLKKAVYNNLNVDPTHLPLIALYSMVLWQHHYMTYECERERER